MSSEVRLSTAEPQRWIVGGEDGWKEADPARCTIEALNKELVGLGNVRVTSCERNDTGRFVLTQEMCKTLNGFPGACYEDMPPFYDLRVEVKGDRHVEGLVIMLPVHWNQRFLAIGGAGNRTDNGFGFDLPSSRVFSVPNSVKNGFASGLTNGGVWTPMVTNWALDAETGELDWELMREFGYLATHRLAVVAKEVIKAAYGEYPEYSYFQGASGGGRQAIVEAQKYPDDFDGIWADCPAINWTKFIPAELWPCLVMNVYNDPLPMSKLDAFRDMVIKRCGGEDAFFSRVDAADVNAYDAVGTETADGPITELDATVMQDIWEGPRDEAGEFLWYGLRPGTVSWNDMGFGLACCRDGKILPWNLATMYLGEWVARDYGWDWEKVGIADFASMFRRGVNDFEEALPESPDLRALGASGHKLMISHGVLDMCIFPDGTLDYYNRAIDIAGSKDELKKYARLFLFPGTSHGTIDDYPSFTMADGMVALMRWVEEGIAPERVKGHLLDKETFALIADAEIESF